MQVKADDGVQHLGLCDIDRHVRWKFGENIQHAGEAIFQDQDAFGAEIAACLVGCRQHAQHHRAFDDEFAVPAGQVAFLDVAKGSDPWIVRSLYRNGTRAIRQGRQIIEHRW